MALIVSCEMWYDYINVDTYMVDSLVLFWIKDSYNLVYFDVHLRIS